MDEVEPGHAWPSGGHSIHELGRPDITELELGKKTHKVAVVQPLDVDGVRTMIVGTILWGVLAVVLAVRGESLRVSGHEWWLWTAVTGCVLGVLGTIYCVRRRRALAQR